MNWLDRLIAPFDPARAFRRVQYRQALALTKRLYEGAAGGRHTDGWRTAATSANAEIGVSGAKLRERSRALVRDNAHAATAVNVLATNIVGEGIMARPNTGSEAKNKKIIELFDLWCDECDAGIELDFYGLQNLVCREMVEAGEVIVRRRWRRATDGYRVPLQLQIMEADHLDDAKTGVLPSQNKAVSGIEFNFLDQPQAYWLFPDHPGEAVQQSYRTSYQSTPVPRSEICHVYEKQRTQARGVPWASPAIRGLRDIDDYDFAELIRKKIEASVVGVVTADDETVASLTQSGAGPQVVDNQGRPVEKFTPGQWLYARGGKEVKFNQPTAVGGYAEFHTTNLRKVATGFRVPYELMTGDLSAVNYSSIRAGLVEFRRFVRRVQQHVIIPMMLDRIWQWFCEALVVSGDLQPSDLPVPVLWQPPKFDWVDPYKDVLAELIAIRSGIRTWQEVVTEHGRNPADVHAEFVQWNGWTDKDNMTFDSDPRRVSLRGVMQKGILDPTQQDEPLQDSKDVLGESDQADGANGNSLNGSGNGVARH